jgi:hypothetical protein
MRRSPLRLLQQRLQLVQATLKLVVLPYPTFELDGAKLCVGYLIRYGGRCSLYATLQDCGVKISQQSLDLSYLRVEAALSRALGSLRSGSLAFLGKGRIVGVAIQLR